MSLAQICIVAALNALAAIFMALQKRPRRDRGVSLILAVTILVGLAVLWRSFGLG